MLLHRPFRGEIVDSPYRPDLLVLGQAGERDDIVAVVAPGLRGVGQHAREACDGDFRSTGPFQHTDAGIACAPALEPTFDELGNELPATEPHVNLCPAMTITRSDHSPITEYLITNIKAKTGSFYPAEIKKCVGLIIETANAFYAHSAYKYSIKESENKSSAWETVPSVQHPMPELSEKLNNEAEAASEEGQ